MTRNRMRPIHPGEILREEFLVPLEMSAHALSQAIRVPATRVNDIVNGRRGITADTAYVASAIRQIPGPVLAVGHSYGGAIITNAAPHAGNVVGLVYVSPSPQTKARPSRTSKATPRTAS